MRASACCSWAVCRRSEQDLDQANIRLLLQQVSGEAVPQRMRRYSLLDLGHLGSSMNGTVELARRYWEQPITSREQPHRRSRDAIPIAQQFEQHGREHRKAILAPLALLDPQQHALGIDVGYLECYDLGDAQSGAIGGSQRSLVLRSRCSLQQANDLFLAQHRGYLARLAHERQVSSHVCP